MLLGARTLLQGRGAFSNSPPSQCSMTWAFREPFWSIFWSKKGWPPKRIAQTNQTNQTPPATTKELILHHPKQILKNLWGKDDVDGVPLFVPGKDAKDVRMVQVLQNPGLQIEMRLECQKLFWLILSDSSGISFVAAPLAWGVHHPTLPAAQRTWELCFARWPAKQHVCCKSWKQRRTTAAAPCLAPYVPCHKPLGQEVRSHQILNRPQKQSDPATHKVPSVPKFTWGAGMARMLSHQSAPQRW